MILRDFEKLGSLVAHDKNGSWERISNKIDEIDPPSLLKDMPLLTTNSTGSIEVSTPKSVNWTGVIPTPITITDEIKPCDLSLKDILNNEEINKFLEKEKMKDNILVVIGNKAYKPRMATCEAGDIHKNWMRPFNEYKIEVTECPSAERCFTPDAIRRAYSKPEKIIFNGPATIVFWKDGTKTVVKAENEPFDPEKGIAMAYLKKFLGNKGNYFNTIKKAIKMAECVE